MKDRSFLRRILLAFVLLGLALTVAEVREPHAPKASLADEVVSIRAWLEPEQATIGDHIRLTVVLEYNSAGHIRPPIAERYLGTFEVLKLTTSGSPPLFGARARLALEYTLITFSSGSHSVPPLSFTYIDPLGVEEQVTTPPLVVLVQGVLGTDITGVDLRDLKEPIEWRNPLAPYLRPGWLWAMGALAMLFSVVLAVSVAKRSRPGRKYLSLQTPEDRARDELDRIASLGLLESNDLRSYYILIAECIRSYIVERYRSIPPGLTRGELRAAMAKAGAAPWESRIVYGLLEECDAVKFARYTPALERGAVALAMAHEAINTAEKTRAHPNALRERDDVALVR